MPIHEYQCTKCGEITEKLILSGDKELKTCPECSGKVTKLMSSNNFILKGTGWYVTDYKNKDKPKPKKPKIDTKLKETK